MLFDCQSSFLLFLVIHLLEDRRWTLLGGDSLVVQRTGVSGAGRQDQVGRGFGEFQSLAGVGVRACHSGIGRLKQEDG